MNFEEIDQKIFKYGFIHPNLIRRNELEGIFCKLSKKQIKKIFIPTENLFDENVALLFSKVLSFYGDYEIIVGEKRNAKSFFPKLKYVLSEPCFQADLILNIDFPLKKSSKLLTIIRAIKCKCLFQFLNTSLYIEKDEIIKSWKEAFSIGYREINSDIQKYTKENNKLYWCKRIIIDYYYIKDFLHAEEWLTKAKEIGKDDELLELDRLWQDIRLNLMHIKNKINKDSIVINWIDAVRYSDLELLPFVKSQCESGIEFTKMYAHVPYTFGALRTIFSGKDFIDDRLYRIRNKPEYNSFFENSELVRIVEAAGYKLEGISSHFSIKYFQNDVVAKYSLLSEGSHVPSTIIQFEAIKALSQQNNTKRVLIIHNLIETHTPRINPIDCKYYNLSSFDGFDIQRDSIPQKLNSAKYLDEQIKWYEKFYTDVRYKIYLSDHGHTIDENWFGIEERYHVLFSIVGKKNVSPIAIDRMCSLKSFPSIIKHCLENDLDSMQKEICNDYVLIQMDDPYGGNSGAIKHKDEINVLEYFQCRGVVTKEDGYVKLANGLEFYFLEDMKNNYINDKRYADRIEYLKGLSGNKWIDIHKEDMYKNSIEYYNACSTEIAKDLDFL